MVVCQGVLWQTVAEFTFASTTLCPYVLKVGVSNLKQGQHWFQKLLRLENSGMSGVNSGVDVPKVKRFTTKMH